MKFEYKEIPGFLKAWHNEDGSLIVGKYIDFKNPKMVSGWFYIKDNRWKYSSEDFMDVVNHMEKSISQPLIFYKSGLVCGAI